MMDDEPTPDPRSDDRRELILASSLSGIDALEVLDAQAPAGTPRQRTLIVTLFRAVPSGFSAANVRLDGGVRIQDIGVAWAFPAPRIGDGSIPDDVISSTEQGSLKTYLSSRFPDPAVLALQLVVRTGSGTHDYEGDLSTYTLRLAAAADDDSVPPGFDLKFSSIDFQFKVECPREYDCAPAGAADCPPDAGTPPRIDYLTKDYGSFRRLMLDRLATIMPGWAERNPADVGVMLVEVLAYVADRLSYRQDAVATEAYLGTARRRVSVRRHARLLDYFMHDGCNARAWVSIASHLPDGVVLPAGTTFSASSDSGSPVLNPADLDSDARLYESLHDLTLHEAHSQISLYPWGSWSWFLPKGATHATLQVTGAPLALQPGDAIVFVERIGSDGTTGGADSRRRQAVRLTAVGAPATDPLTGATLVEVHWDPADALAFPFCVSMIANEQKLRDVSVALGNVVLVDAGAWVDDGAALPAPAPGAIYRPRLRQSGVTARQPFTAGDLGKPAVNALQQDPRKALPIVRLKDDSGVAWQAVPDLLSSGPDDADFVVEVESDGTAQLRFGDGVLGLPPSADSQIVASYRVASGPDDNVGADAINHVIADGVANLTTVAGVRNPLPAAGGTAPEDLELVRRQAPRAFQTQQRAVTEDDYAAMAASFSGIHRAVAQRRWTGSWYTVFISVDPQGTTTLAPQLVSNLEGFLEAYRLAGEDLEITGPVYVPLEIVLEVCVAAGYFRSDVEAALTDAFSSGRRRDGSLGFFHPDNYSFGDPVYVSQIVAAAMKVPGVDWVDLSDPTRGQKFVRFGRPAANEIGLGYMPIGRFEIARADSSPDFPENGRISFLMEGGL